MLQRLFLGNPRAKTWYVGTMPEEAPRSLIFTIDSSRPSWENVREAWLLQFPDEPGVYFYFCTLSEEYTRLLGAGRGFQGRDLLIRGEDCSLLRRYDRPSDARLVFFCPTMAEMESADWCEPLRDQHLIVIFPEYFSADERAFVLDQQPRALCARRPIPFPDEAGLEEWREAVASQQ